MTRVAYSKSDRFRCNYSKKTSMISWQYADWLETVISSCTLLSSTGMHGQTSRIDKEAQIEEAKIECMHMETHRVVIHSPAVVSSLSVSCCGNRMLSPTDRKWMGLWRDDTADWNTWLSKQNPKYSFLSYHATQHEWNTTCILLEGITNHISVSYQHCGCTSGERLWGLVLWLAESDPHWAQSETSLHAAMLDIFG